MPMTAAGAVDHFTKMAEKEIAIIPTMSRAYRCDDFLDDMSRRHLGI
ncbi:hypothetical protein PBN151_3473 [Paenibacillus sp. NAIST15-1]|nr:hypothetical protein PBN151_3473 [Paenibacillus sp. NAIST15-1]